MKLKVALFGSVLVNIVFIVLLSQLLNTHPHFPRGPSQITPLVNEQRTKIPRWTTLASSKSSSGIQSPGVTFDWRQVESDDYKQYILNLRAIGCPEKTVREIIQADVNDLFASRIAAITHTNQYRYWTSEPAARSDEQKTEIRNLLEQKQEVLKALGFGDADFKDTLGDAFLNSLEDIDAQLDFLPDFKKQQIREILAAKARREAINGEAEADDDTEAQIQSKLTPDEFKEYELRCSTDAVALRGTLVNLEMTEEEFRAIFSAWRSLKTYSVGTPEYAAAQALNEANLQQLLGSNRFNIFLADIRLLGYPQ